MVFRPFGTFSRGLNPHQRSALKTSQPYDLEGVTEMTMYGAAHTLLLFIGTAGRCPGLVGVALSARSGIPDTAAGGKDHSGVAAREIV